MTKDDVRLIPYTDGSAMLPDNALLGMFDAMLRDKTLHVAFYDGSVKDEDDWLKFCKSGHHLFFAILCKDKPAGFVWLTNLREGASDINFVAFSKFWGEESIRIGRCALDAIFDLRDEHGYFFDVLVCNTPSDNTLAARYIDKLGAKYAGVIPNSVKKSNGDKADMLIKYFLREEDQYGGSNNAAAEYSQRMDDMSEKMFKFWESGDGEGTSAKKLELGKIREDLKTLPKQAETSRKQLGAINSLIDASSKVDVKERVNRSYNDAMNAIGKSEEMFNRNISRMGVDPNSGTFASMKNRNSIENAKLLAHTTNTAKQQADDEKYNKLLAAASINV